MLMNQSPTDPEPLVADPPADADVEGLVADLLHDDVDRRLTAAHSARGLVGTPAFIAVVDGLINSLDDSTRDPAHTAVSLTWLGPDAIRPVARHLRTGGDELRDAVLFVVIASLSLQADPAMRRRVKMMLRYELFADEDAPELVLRACTTALARLRAAEERDRQTK